jgi:hypothetical protein
MIIELYHIKYGPNGFKMQWKQHLIIKLTHPWLLIQNIIRTEKGSGNGTRLIFFLMIIEPINGSNYTKVVKDHIVEN